MSKKVTIIGAGLAGSEAALTLADNGIQVSLYEMKPKEKTPAQKLDTFAELVCSNSLRSNDIATGPGLLKQEMRELGGHLIQIADACAVPAGSSLAVDRIVFSKRVTDALHSHSNITIIQEKVTEIPSDTITIIATGPLTASELATQIRQTFSSELYFYDAIAPIIDADSIDYDKVFWASRYDKGEGDDYINCPMNEEQYYQFINDLNSGEKVPHQPFEEAKYFESCLPIEVMAERGVFTLAHGPLKPVGLVDPKTNTRPFAVIQLRSENLHKTAFNMVGCQTKLTYSEQKRIFQKIPGLENAEFLRFGQMHRNTYLNGPQLLDPYFRSIKLPHLYFAGQISGVEGYIESMAVGLLVALSLRKILNDTPFVIPPAETALGSLNRYATNLNLQKQNFQPSNINFGLLPPLENKIRDKHRKKEIIAQRALKALKEWKNSL